MTTATQTFTSGQRVLVNGRAAEIIEPAVCGCCRYKVRFTDSGEPGYADHEATVVAADTEPEPRPFRAGDRVRLTRGIGGRQGGEGEVGTLERVPDYPGNRLGFRPDGATDGGGYGGGLYQLNYTDRPACELIEPEPTVASGEPEADSEALAEAVRRAERAERDLQAFRDKVRERLIDEAERRDWCSEADDWLESLGLERRSNDQRATVAVTISLTVYVDKDVPGDICESIDYDDVRRALVDEHGSQMQYVDFDYSVEDCERL